MTNATTFTGVSAADIVVFSILQVIELSALVGNSFLLKVILRFRHLEKPSFTLIASLAGADLMHAVVCLSYFYPPIVLKVNYFPENVYRWMNALDWTAWGITISHMSAIAFDRLLAIVMFGDYGQLVTARKYRIFTGFCWSTLFATNATLVILKSCCPIVPLPEMYTFDYVSPENFSGRSEVNVYPIIYMPLEIACMGILAVTSPVTLVRVYKRYKRKRTMRNASLMLLQASGLMRPKINAPKKSIIQNEMKVFLQIVTVTCIFFVYMATYYLFFYVANVNSKWSAVFNSLFYSITHMVNPIVYFSFNDEMRMQAKSLFTKCWAKRDAPGNQESAPLLASARLATKSSVACSPPSRKEGVRLFGNFNKNLLQVEMERTEESETSECTDSASVIVQAVNGKPDTTVVWQTRQPTPDQISLITFDELNDVLI